MESSGNKRQRRIPFTQEEVNLIIAVKKRKDLIKLKAFKSTIAFRFLNIFNVCSFFIYCEIIFCCFGPVSYQRHCSVSMSPVYSNHYDQNGKQILNELDVVDVNDLSYKVLVNDFMEIPSQLSIFYVGKDYIFSKELRFMISGSNAQYRLFSSSPMLILSFIIVVMLVFAYAYNLNENQHSLMALTIMNALTLVGIFFL